MALFETIPYKVIKKDRPFEIRSYDTFLLASTKTIPNERYDSGFMNVFNYISGKNESQQKVSMTTPVVSYEEQDQLITGFYVPSKYNKTTTPKPLDKTVFIEEKKASLYGVIRFSGAWRESLFNKKEALLKDYLKKHDYQLISKRILLRYQPPFIPGIFRRNEIAFEIEKNT